MRAATQVRLSMYGGRVNVTNENVGRNKFHCDFVPEGVGVCRRTAAELCVLS